MSFNRKPAIASPVPPPPTPAQQNRLNNNNAGNNKIINEKGYFSDSSNGSDISPTNLMDRYFVMMSPPPPPPPLAAAVDDNRNHVISKLHHHHNHQQQQQSAVPTKSLVDRYPAATRNYHREPPPFVAFQGGPPPPPPLISTSVVSQQHSTAYQSIVTPPPPLPKPKRIGSQLMIPDDNNNISNPSPTVDLNLSTPNRSGRTTRQQSIASQQLEETMRELKRAQSDFEDQLQISPGDQATRLEQEWQQEFDYTVNREQFERDRQEEERYRQDLRKRQTVILDFKPLDENDLDEMLGKLASQIRKQSNAGSDISRVSNNSSNYTRDIYEGDYNYHGINGGVAGQTAMTRPQIPVVPAPISFNSRQQQQQQQSNGYNSIKRSASQPTTSQSHTKPKILHQNLHRHQHGSQDDDSMSFAQIERSLDQSVMNAVDNPRAVTVPSIPSAAATSSLSSQSTRSGRSIVKQNRDELIKAALASGKKVKRAMLRIFIEDSNSYRTVVVDSLMTAVDLVQVVIANRDMNPYEEWTLFEIVDELGIERPLRDYENVVEVMETWGRETTNVLLVKKYGFRQSLSIEEKVHLSGWLDIELKPGKWQRRFCELTPNGLYYSKKATGTSEGQICFIINSDVYTMTRSRKNIPTKFCFAIKRQEPSGTFEEIEDSVKFLCADHVEKMKEWVLLLRQAKSQKIYETISSSRTASTQYASSNSTKPLLSRKTGNLLPGSGGRDAGASENDDDNLPLAAAISTPQRSFDNLRRPSHDNSSTSASHQYPQQHQRSHHQTQSSPSSPLSQSRSEQGSSSAEKVTRQYGKKLITADMVNNKPLVQVIDRVKGNYVGANSNEPINKSQFGAPLVPLSHRELDNIPGVDLKKLQPPTKPGSRRDVSSTVKACGECGCTDFAKGRFNERNCANCFHPH